MKYTQEMIDLFLSLIEKFDSPKIQLTHAQAIKVLRIDMDYNHNKHIVPTGFTDITYNYPEHGKNNIWLNICRFDKRPGTADEIEERIILKGYDIKVMTDDWTIQRDINKLWNIDCGLESNYYRDEANRVTDMFGGPSKYPGLQFKPKETK